MERSARTEEAARPTRKQLKAALSRSVPAGGERTVLRDAERALSDAQQLTRTLRRERTALSRQIAVRERKLCDWKGKLPYDGAANADAMERALARAGDMPWRRIADVQSAGDNACALTLRNAYVRAAGALAGFGGAWVLCADGDGLVRATACRILRVQEREGRIDLQLPHEVLADGDVVDIKPYLAYCDAWPTGGADARDARAAPASAAGNAGIC